MQEIPYLVQFSSGPNVAFVEGFLIPGGNNYSSGFIPYQFPSPPPLTTPLKKERIDWGIFSARDGFRSI
jgi:hypothetical protein